MGGSGRFKRFEVLRRSAKVNKSGDNKRMKDSVVTRLARGTGTTLIRMVDFARKNPFDPMHAHAGRAKLKALAIALVITVVLTLLVTKTGVTAGVETQFYDWKVRTLSPHDKADDRIVVIAIDNQSLSDVENAGEGNLKGWVYPWPRFLYNRIAKYCEEAGAKAVVFDMLFAQSGGNTNDTMSTGVLDPEDLKLNDPEFFAQAEQALGRPFTKPLKQFGGAWDDMMAAELNAHDNVIVGAILSGTKLSESRPHLERFARDYQLLFTGNDADAQRERLFGRGSIDFVTPLPQLVTGELDFYPPQGKRLDEMTPEERETFRTRAQLGLTAGLLSKRKERRFASALPDKYQPQGVAGIGFVDAQADALDGVFRSYQLGVFAGTDADIDGQKKRIEDSFPSLALEAVRVASGYPRGTPVEVSGNTWKFGEYRIPVEDDGSVRLKFRARQPAEKTFGADTISKEQLAERFPKGDAPWSYTRIPASLVMQDWEHIYQQRLYDTDEKFKANWDKSRAADSAMPASPIGRLKLGNPKDLLGGKIVLIAGTANTLYDIRPNPLSPNANGVELHATMIDNILNNDYIRPAPEIPVILQTATCAAAMAAVVVYAPSYWLALLAFIGLVGSSVGLSFGTYTWGSMDWPMAGPAIAAAVAFVASVILKFFTLDAHTRQMRSVSEQYMGSELVDFVIDNPQSLKLGGEKRDMTIYFSDVAGFTTMSERLGPEKLTELLNVYLSAMTQVIINSGGIIDKYIGDAVMALWGAPRKLEDHAYRGCKAALACRQELYHLQPRLKEIAPELIRLGADGKPLYNLIEARAGINTGVVTAGNMGSHMRFSYTVMGDAVNQAARFEGANKEYGSWIMIGEDTEKKVRGQFVVRPLDLLVVKGKTEPKAVFELLAEGDMPDDQQRMLRLYLEAYGMYRDRQFALARDKFADAAKLELTPDDNPSLVYVERCEAFIETAPPSDWNGVYILKTK